MELKELVGKFADNAGIERAPSVGGVWKFSADGNVFGVTGDESGERVWLFGEIVIPDPGRKDALVKAAMEANYFHGGTGGATFSLNPNNGALTLFDSRRLDALDEAAFYSFVEKFVNSLATWNALAGEPGGKIEEPPPATPDEFVARGFMSV